MVNHLNTTFAALADPTRRTIVRRLIDQDTLTIKELAEPFSMSLVAVSKHIRILERAQLVTRTKIGRDNVLSANPLPLREVYDWLRFYEQYWNSRFDALEAALVQQKPPRRDGIRKKSARPRGGVTATKSGVKGGPKRKS